MSEIADVQRETRNLLSLLSVDAAAWPTAGWGTSPKFAQLVKNRIFKLDE
jgi:hypothetical protein